MTPPLKRAHRAHRMPEYTPAERRRLTQRAAELYPVGLSLKAVAAELGVSHSTVRLMLAEAGVAVRGKNGRPPGARPRVRLHITVPPAYHDELAEYARHRDISVPAAAVECIGRTLGYHSEATQ